MPLRIPDKLPAIDILKEENIFLIDDTCSHTQDLYPLKIIILNLMPLKITTETDFVRLLSNTPLQIDITFMKLKSHTPKNTPIEHILMFYKDFDSIKNEKFDGMIVTGAPIEKYEYEDVDYWKELTKIFDWAKIHVTSTLYICWAAQAALYHFYGIPKYSLPKKMFGIFEQYCNDPLLPIFRGFDDIFYMPHSRHTEIRKEDILKNDELKLISESKQSGVGIVMANNGREFFITGHFEYAPNTLNNEYHRDKGKRTDVEIPKNYYKDNDPNKKPIVKWKAHANLFFMNWINYYVSPKTPYNINLIK